MNAAALAWSGTVLGVLAISCAVICLVALRRQRAALAAQRWELACLCEQRDECDERIAELSGSVEFLEVSRKNIAEAGEGLTRSRRAQAMQLLKSGFSPEKAAASLDMPRSEMRLIASVSRMLSQ